MLLLWISIFALIVGIIWWFDLAFRIKLCLNCCHIEFSFNVFYSLIPLHFRIRIEWSLEDGVFVILLRKNGTAKILSEIGHKSGKKKRTRLIKGILSEAYRWLSLKDLHAEGCIGVKEDAFECIMLTGALKTMLETSFRIILNRNEQEAKLVQIRPNFTIDLFRLNLEGIFRIRPMQIMIAAVKWYIDQRGFGNYGSSHREHHENNYGAN